MRRPLWVGCGRSPRFTLNGIADLVVQLFNDVAPIVAIPDDVLVEAQFSLPTGSSASAVSSIGQQTSLSCPSCGGPLWRVGKQSTAIYRCSIGHVGV